MNDLVYKIMTSWAISASSVNAKPGRGNIFVGKLTIIYSVHFSFPPRLIAITYCGSLLTLTARWDCFYKFSKMKETEP